MELWQLVSGVVAILKMGKDIIRAFLSLGKNIAPNDVIWNMKQARIRSKYIMIMDKSL